LQNKTDDKNHNIVHMENMNRNLVRITDTKSTNNVHKVWYTSPKLDNVISADKHNIRGIVFNEHSTIITGQWDLSFQWEILYTLTWEKWITKSRT